MQEIGQISFTRIGDHALVYNGSNGLLALLNPVGSLICRAYLVGKSADQISSMVAQEFDAPVEQVADDVDRFLAEWRLSGFLEPASAPMVLPELPNEALECIVLCLNQVTVAIHHNLPAEATWIFNRLSHRRLAATASVTITLISNGSGITFFRQGRLVCETTDLDQGSGRLYELLLAADQFEHPVLFFLHAACVHWNKTSILLCGLSGSGKTTLAAALCVAGAAYLGDELAAVSAADFSVSALPSCLSVKHTGTPVMEAITHVAGPLDSPALWNLDPSLFAQTIKRAPAPTLLLFPTYDSDAPFELRRLDPTEALERLLLAGASFGVDSDSPNLGALIRWIESVPAYRCVFAQSDTVIQAVRELSLA
jgi:hypothetical protein